MESLVQLRPSNSNPLLTCLVLAMLFGSALGSRHGLPERATAQIQMPNAPKQFLAEHNQARAAVHVSPLNWNQSLTKEARRLASYQRDRKSCQSADLSSIDYGSNQAGGGHNMTPRQAVARWVSEGQFYNHAKNSCAQGHQCGVYTQVVWNTTSEVGCAQARCVMGDTTLTICLYFPPGNYPGESPYW